MSLLTEPDIPEVRLVSQLPRLTRSGWGVLGVPSGWKNLPFDVGADFQPIFLSRIAGSSWSGRVGERLEALVPEGASWTVFGLGEPEHWSLEAAEKFIVSCVMEALDRSASELFLAVPMPSTWVARSELVRLARAAALATYRFDRHRSNRKARRLARIFLGVPELTRGKAREAMAWAEALIQGIAWARNLANEPPNFATPEALAESVASIVRSWGGRTRIWRRRELERRGFGGILAVGSGSQNPPCLLRLELGEGAPMVGLVGKGVTFDSGGLSLKPAERMDEMKWDKAGACAVVGVLAALAVRPLPIRVRAYLPLAENLPDGSSFRPGDILRCVNGTTVEITNTDAEGRLLLADSLALAVREDCNPILDLATLTGACVVALGTSGAGLFSNSEELARDLLESAQRAGERLWRLPLWPEFREQMQGLHADLRNSGDRWGGACTAAAFLASFLDSKTAWAHLDIAGPAYRGRGESGIRGATGFGVATVYEWLSGLATGQKQRQ